MNLFVIGVVHGSVIVVVSVVVAPAGVVPTHITIVIAVHPVVIDRDTGRT